MSDPAQNLVEIATLYAEVGGELEGEPVTLAEFGLWLLDQVAGDAEAPGWGDVR